MFVLDRERHREKKRRTVALILSLFIPGLGQLMRKRIASGMFFLVTFSFIIWLVAELQRINYGIIGTSLGLLIVYCFNLFDAYKGPTRGSAPCEKSCPAGINIPFYIALIREGRFSDALISVMDRMPFPAACGRICHHPCESVCALRTKEGPIAIECLKRAAGDFGTLSLQAHQTHRNPRSVGIIGAGPAGLSAGYFLARQGYQITVYEKEAEPGGLLRWGIPAFRLPKELVSGEIALLQQFGIDIKCGVTIGTDIPYDEVKNNHDALLITVGTPFCAALELPGVELEGVSYALDMLRNMHHGKELRFKGSVAVIGGGNTAFDAARTAVRHGAEKVTIYYRRNAQEMPGNMEELTMAQREGVAIEYHAAPLRFMGEKRVSGIEFARTELKKVPGKSRSIVTPIEGSNFTVPCRCVLIATGQEPDLTFLPDDMQKKAADKACIRVHPRTLATMIPGMFAAGDITGIRMKTVVDAVEMGRTAAQGIDWYLRGVTGCRRMVERLTSFDYPLSHTLPRKRRVKGKRQAQKLLEREKATSSNDEVELGLSEEQTKKEASRCLQCNRLG